MTGVLIPTPTHNHTGPNDTVQSIYRRSAKNLRGGYPVGGSNTAESVARTLDSIADALDAGVTPRALDTLRELRVKNTERRARWHTPETIPWTGADWGNAMGGECGEAQNVVKKLRRIETGTKPQDQPGGEVLVQMLADELADTITYADLLADHYGIDLRVAIAAKFNAVSEREGFPDRMTVPIPGTGD